MVPELAWVIVLFRFDKEVKTKAGVSSGVTIEAEFEEDACNNNESTPSAFVHRRRRDSRNYETLHAITRTTHCRKVQRVFRTVIGNLAHYGVLNAYNTSRAHMPWTISD